MLISPRWRKVLGDISETPLRTGLAVVAMAAGVFGLGMVLTAYAVLTRELANTYRDTRPASAILIADRVDDAVAQAARQVQGVVDAEARPTIRGRVRVGKDLWAPLVLFAVRDFNDLRIDILKRDSGAWPPTEDGMLLERSCVSLIQTAGARAEIGDSLTIKIADGAEQSVKLEGTVHAAGLAPGWMDHAVSGFVSSKSRVRSHESESAALRIVVDRSARNEAQILKIANLVKAALLQLGHVVTRVEIAPPGRHPHADQMDTFLYLLGAFGALTLALSAVMAAGMIHALLAEQVKQVGVMKAIGATTLQITGMYLGQVSILAAISLCVGMPLGLSAGRAYARFAATILNATIGDESVPRWAMAVQIAVGMIVPILVSLGPTYRASRITVHEALNALASRRPFGERRFDRSLARMHWLPRPLMLSLRSTFHRRGRLISTVGTLAMGGAVFISALNVSGAWDRTLADDAATRPYDIELRLSRNYPTTRVSEALAAVPDVERFEFWSEYPAYVETAAGLPARIELIGPAPGSKLIAPRILSGRWLEESDQQAVVVNQGLLAGSPALRVGGKLATHVHGRDVTWAIVGVLKEMNPIPTAYAPLRAVQAAIGQDPQVTASVRIVTRRHGPKDQLQAAQNLDRAFDRAGIGIRDTVRLLDRLQALADHLVIIKSALILAALLVVLVGGLGLTSTLTLNVVERTRELGILSAIGARPRTIASHVVFEAVLIGLMSWCIAILLSAPISMLIETVTGKMFHKGALAFFLAPSAAALWLALVAILAVASSFYPAWRAGRLAIREALTYE